MGRTLRTRKETSLKAPATWDPSTKRMSPAWRDFHSSEGACCAEVYTISTGEALSLAVDSARPGPAAAALFAPFSSRAEYMVHALTAARTTSPLWGSTAMCFPLTPTWGVAALTLSLFFGAPFAPPFGPAWSLPRASAMIPLDHPPPTSTTSGPRKPRPRSHWVPSAALGLAPGSKPRLQANISSLPPPLSGPAILLSRQARYGFLARRTMANSSAASAKPSIEVRVRKGGASRANACRWGCNSAMRRPVRSPLGWKSWGAQSFGSRSKKGRAVSRSGVTKGDSYDKTRCARLVSSF
mmetsp:Transcript_28764/g.64271  ORF Transcript_28764/g.64271 Transcript_28764/m.64271 type:complete len:297 (-) Transcript_28764:185-1075(-)